MLLHENKPTEALAALRQANQLNSKDEGVRALLISTYLSALRKDFVRHREDATQIESLIPNESQRIESLSEYGRGECESEDDAKDHARALCNSCAR